MTDKNPAPETVAPRLAPVSRAIQPWLTKLLRSMFADNDQLRQFLRGDAGLDIDGDLPGVNLPKNVYAANTADCPAPVREPGTAASQSHRSGTQQRLRLPGFARIRGE
ncbi:MAG: hypothetical protein MJE77_23915 [Proteobacteria bacterium]|nr:hypothetical protein [Pseudomonadota bacterium]